MTEDIRVWLENLGLGKYGDAFVGNDVGTDVLAYLTKDDLEKLGVSLGNRLRLLKVIGAEFAGAPQTVASQTTATEATTAVATDPTDTLQPEPQPSSEGERRPLTVMFCDMADSTALSARLDPEDLQDVIRAYQVSCTTLIQDFDGFVAKYMGDGILVYFGYPKSLERDAERAVRSALAIVEAMAELNRTLGRDKDIEIAVRIGISTGVVMVGEVVGEGMAQERTVIGEAPNIAARLQGLASRNGIVIGSLTKELTGDVFVYEDAGAQELKGITGRVKTWNVVGLRDENSDNDDYDGDIVVPKLVGRDEETGLLRRAWQSVQEEGRGQVVSISGEAGIGKSVLVDGLRAELRADGLPQLVLRCSPYHANSAFYPFVEYLKRLAGWQPEDSIDARLGKLEAALNAFEQPVSETVPVLAALLNLPLPEDHYLPLALTPQQLKQRTQDMCIALILETAERQPLVQLWEDLHWADPSTLELIGLQIEQVPTAPLLMLLTARSEFVAPWPARSHITPITLSRLESQHAAALVSHIADHKPLPEDVVDHIVTKADGVPLYVEELTKTILASDILRDTGDQFELTGPLSSLSIPETLQESLMARLDRLPQVRELAQLGSVLGREFAYEMISGLSAVDDSVLRDGLEQLVDAELLYQRGRPPRARYIFKHALIQDAAYGSLLRRTREHHHLHVAQLMETSFPDIIETSPELIAHHYAEADEAELAIDYFQKAGTRSLRVSANQEAIAHLRNGLEIVETMAAGADRDNRELNLLLTIGPALIAIKGYAAPDVEPAFLRALELCQQIGDKEREFSILQGLSIVYLVRADVHKSRGLAEQLVELAKTREDPGPELAADRSVGYALIMLGELEAGRACFDRITSTYDHVLHHAFALRQSGANFCIASYAFNAWVLYILGYPDQAVESIAQGNKRAQEWEHPLSESFLRVITAVLHLSLGEPKTAREHAKAGFEIATENDLVQYVYWTKITLFSATSELGEGDAADQITGIRETIDACRAIGSNLLSPIWLGLLARAYDQNGQAEESLTVVDEALGEITRTDERIWQADLHRLKGQLLLDRDSANAAEAEACFLEAIGVAQSQKAKSWELRAATALARLWHGQGKANEARDLLTPIHDWFTEGFETTDLKDAKALLDDLA